MIEFWEDISTQQGPLISPVLYRQLIKPRTRDLINAIKSKTKAKLPFIAVGVSPGLLKILLGLELKC